jgi:transcriptional regulator with PAS, ATPase and Fis domain
VAINCGALSPSLLESELFGYGDGAFTGARRGGSDGRLAAADGGTLFLDEVAEMPDALQASLLRALEDGTYTRLGESRARRSRFRLVAATCRDLVAMVRDGAFRKDLFFRIQGAVVTLPALRDRSDRVELARALLARQAARDGAAPRRLSADAERWIDAHDWPGNVRELVHALDHAIALSDGSPVLERAHLPAPMLHAAAAPTSSRKDALRGALEQALDLAQGNMSDAARRLGVARSTLYRMIERYLPERAPRRG